MKNTKRARRAAAFAAAVVMAACAAVPMGSSFSASADDTYTVTIDNTVSGYKYAAYKIFSGNLSGGVLSNIQWADEAKATDALAAAKNITVGEDNSKPFENCTSAADVAKVLGDATETKAELAEKFAAAMEPIFTTVAVEDDFDEDKYELILPSAGYYLIKNTEIPAASADKGTSYTKFILRVSEISTTVTPKTDAPTLEKKIWHNDTVAEPTIGDATPTQAGWGDVGDNQIGDTVYYYTKTSVPDMSNYDTYKYIIRDQMSAGLTMGEVTNIVYVPKTAGASSIDIKANAVITKGDDADTTDFTETFYVSFADLKDVLKTNADGGYIYTYYTATLNKDALVSNSANDTQHNDNTAYLTYSNNPNHSGSGDNETGDTPKDTVYDWTLTFNGSKVDEKNDPLTGAGFTLYAGFGDSVSAEPIQLVAITDLTQVNGVAADENTNYYRIATAAEIADGSVTKVTEMLQNDGKTKFMILGLDDAKPYTLKETTTPATYNTGDDIVINKLHTTYNTAGDEMTVLKADITNEGVALATVENSVQIQNKKGSTLPSTGGIGTTMFYVGGGVLVAGAGVILITKKRAKKDAE